MMSLLKEEFRQAMVLSGCTAISEIQTCTSLVKHSAKAKL